MTRRLNILFLSSIIPWPPVNGHSLRTYNLMRHTAGYHNVFLLAFNQRKILKTIEEEQTSLSVMKEFCEEAYSFPIHAEDSKWAEMKSYFTNLFSPLPYTSQKMDSQEVRHRIRDVLSRVRIDILHCDAPDLAVYANEVKDIPIVVVNHNVESILMRRRATKEVNPLKKAYAYLQARKIRTYERELGCQVEGYVAVSEIDRNKLQKISPEARIVVVENGVDPEYFRPLELPEQENTILMIGAWTWMPNYDSLVYFYENIWPLIQKRLTDASLVLVGRDPCGKVLEIAADGNVKLVGYVDDARPFIARSSAMVVPLRVGGGTRLKILTALAMEKAVVSTSIGCEGIDVTDGRDVMIADSPEAFARRTIEALNSPELRRSLGRSGRLLVETKYDWRILGDKMNDLYLSLATPGALHQRIERASGVTGQ